MIQSTDLQTFLRTASAAEAARAKGGDGEEAALAQLRSAQHLVSTVTIPDVMQSTMSAPEPAARTAQLNVLEMSDQTFLVETSGPRRTVTINNKPDGRIDDMYISTEETRPTLFVWKHYPGPSFYSCAPAGIFKDASQVLMQSLNELEESHKANIRFVMEATMDFVNAPSLDPHRISIMLQYLVMQEPGYDAILHGYAIRNNDDKPEPYIIDLPSDTPHSMASVTDIDGIPGFRILVPQVMAGLDWLRYAGTEFRPSMHVQKTLFVPKDMKRFPFPVAVL